MALGCSMNILLLMQGIWREIWPPILPGLDVTGGRNGGYFLVMSRECGCGKRNAEGKPQKVRWPATSFSLRRSKGAGRGTVSESGDGVPESHHLIGTTKEPMGGQICYSLLDAEMKRFCGGNNDPEVKVSGSRDR